MLELDEPSERTGSFDWPPCREMQPVGFAVPHRHEDWTMSLARTKQELAVELAKMREQLSEKLSEIQQTLSQGKEASVRRRKAQQAGIQVGQRRLPSLPRALSAISQEIRNSQMIFNRPADPSDDLALTCSQETWQRAIGILAAHAISVWKNARAVIRPPVISVGPDGSVDLYWTSAPYGLLLNVPADPKQPATYYGDDATNPDSNRASGKLDSTRVVDPGVLMWLAHTAEQ